MSLSVDTLDSSDSASESEESAGPPEEHASDSFSKLYLYQKWIAASSRTKKLKDTLTDVRKYTKKVEKEKKAVERTLSVLQTGKSKAEKCKYDLSVANVEKAALEEELTFMQAEKKRIETAHKMQSHILFKIES